MEKSDTINYVIDFDSTFTQVEALDELAIISLQNAPDKEKAQKEIKDITDLAMGGELSFRESLLGRLKILKAHRDHIPKLISVLKTKVSPSFVRNKEYIHSNSDRIFIISNGFKEFICPVVEEYGIPKENVYANNFSFDEEGNVDGFDSDNILSGDTGKPAVVKSMNLSGKVHVIGDGYTDYEIRKFGMAERFYAFTENVSRQKVVECADIVAASLDEIINQN